MTGAPDPMVRAPVTHGGPSAPDALAARLLEAMDGRSINWLAKRAKVARVTVQKMLRGERKRLAYVGTIQDVAEACGVSPGWLAFGGVK